MNGDDAIVKESETDNHNLVVSCIGERQVSGKRGVKPKRGLAYVTKATILSGPIFVPMNKRRGRREGKQNDRDQYT